VNDTLGSDVEVSWWRERNREVDFVARHGRTVVAVEVKSGRRASALPGLDAFAETFKPKRTLIVGAQGIPLEEFLLTPVATWLK
jgi:predicted AAA+ superfamily ATPase